jgi:Domain of unknown function (DUF4129)
MSGATRVWNEVVAGIADLVRGGIPTLVFLSFVAAVLFALGWYFWPSWLPWHWRLRDGHGGDSRTERRTGWRGRFRIGALRWRLRRRRRRARVEEEQLDLPADLLPDLPAEVLALTADQLAAAGRYAEAVRERLRAIVRDLIERGVLPHSPGWTVTELAAAAGRARPPLAAPLADGVSVFSEIWYGLRPATAGDDTAMRGHADALARGLAEPAPAPAGRNA